MCFILAGAFREKGVVIMYRVLIADDDILMREALEKMVSKEKKFQVIQATGTGDKALEACMEQHADIIFMGMQMLETGGTETGKQLHQLYPDMTIYMIAEYNIAGIVRTLLKGSVKDVLEKPITFDKISKILENYKMEHENSVQAPLERLTEILRKHDFGQFYYDIAEIIDEIYEIVGNDSEQLIKVFHYIGQNLLNTKNFAGESQNIDELFPINEGLILEHKTSELWLFRLMDYLFRCNSESRYQVLENVFVYIEGHIREDITLNKIIDNCSISQGYLSRIFREQFQVSVTEYLHMRKIHLAKGYFYFTDDSIAEVAFRIGYNESSYFSKVFKKYEKMTVKEYRNGVCRQQKA